jgi:DNA-binding HxlR family transcriptional regulator
MRRTSFDGMNCSVAQCLEAIGEWWTPLLIRDLFMGVSRFDDFQARLGISRNILTERLNRLVELGVVDRIPYQHHPERYDYRLTEKGADLWLVMTAMREWGDRWAAPQGPPLEVVHRACDHVTTIVPTCSECGEVLERRDLRMVDGPGARERSVPPGRVTA